MPLPPANAQYVRAAEGCRLGEEATGRCQHIDAVPGAQLIREILRHAAVIVDPHADAQVTIVSSAADRIGASHFLPADLRAHSRRAVREESDTPPAASSGTSKEMHSASLPSGCTSATLSG